MRRIAQELRDRGLHGECRLTAVRSGGSGGQHVNKVSSRVELRFQVRASERLGPEEKERVLRHLAGRITAQGELIVVCQQERSQRHNRQACIERFYQLIARALKPVAPRVPTVATRASARRRLARKRLHSDRKRARGGVDVE